MNYIKSLHLERIKILIQFELKVKVTLTNQYFSHQNQVTYILISPLNFPDN